MSICNYLDVNLYTLIYEYNAVNTHIYTFVSICTCVHIYIYIYIYMY